MTRLRRTDRCRRLPRPYLVDPTRKQLVCLHHQRTCACTKEAR